MSRKLNIKNLAPRKNGLYRQGLYVLMFPEKYIGDQSKIIYRSSYEKIFCTYCDTNNRVIKWSSEPLQIPYLHPFDNIMRPYNVDFYVKVEISKDNFKEFLAEVKPARQLVKPNSPAGRITEAKMGAYHKAIKTYMINITKFEAGKRYAAERGMEFIIVTEKFLF